MAEDNQKAEGDQSKEQMQELNSPAPDPTEKKDSLPSEAESETKSVNQTEPVADVAPVTTEANAKPEPTRTVEPVAATRKVRLWPLWLMILLLIILMGAMGAAGFLGWKELQSLQSVKSDFAQIDAQLSAKGEQAKSDDQALRNDIKTLSDTIRGVTQDISRKQRQLQEGITTNANQILQIGGTTRTEWLLAEAEYLLRLANQRLNFEKDVAGALAILQAADEVLRDSGDAGIYGVREQLKKEVLALQSQALIDDDGIYLELEAIIGLLDQLEQKVYASEPDSETGKHGTLGKTDQMVSESPEQADAASVQGDGDNWLHKLREDLSPLFVFRKMDQPVEPLLSPEQTYYLKQNLRLMLEQAQLALMKKHQSLFEKSIRKAYQWVDTYFLDSNRTTRVLLEKLAALKDEVVDPDLPTIAKSLNMLKERISLLSRRQAADNEG